MYKGLLLISSVVCASALPAQREIAPEIGGPVGGDTELFFDGQGRTTGGTSEVEGGQREARDFGNLARILAIAGTGPKQVDPSGGYAGRRRRRQADQLAVEARPAGSAVVVAPPATSGRDFGNIAEILRIANATPQKVDLSGSYTRKRKRSAEEPRTKHGLVPEVSLHAVKIKSRGKYGNLAHPAVAGSTPSRTVFDDNTFGRRRRRSVFDFIPFSENEQQKVDTLKIEQTDFLAQSQRLKQSKAQAERPKRKFNAY